VATGVSPPTLDGADPSRARCAYETLAARALLTLAGYPNSIALELWSSPTNPWPRLPQSMPAYLGVVGIRVTLVQRNAPRMRAGGIGPSANHVMPAVVLDDGSAWLGGGMPLVRGERPTHHATRRLQLLARRLMLAVPTPAGVLVVVCLLLHVAPSDPVQAMVRERADAVTIARRRAERQLDAPLPVPVPCARYAGNIVRGDRGRPYITNRPIVHDIAERFPRTLLLAGAAVLLATLRSVTIGALAAIELNSWVDRVALAATDLGISRPVYWIGLLLSVLFAVTLRWLPASGYGRIEFLALPALAFGSRRMAYLTRGTRGAMLEARNADVVRTARAMGLAGARVMVRHALRNALISVVTVIGFDFGAHLTGSLLTETIFSWPGIGRNVVMAISRRDLPAVPGAVLFRSLVCVTVNLLTDVAYRKVDPLVA